MKDFWGKDQPITKKPTGYFNIRKNRMRYRDMNQTEFTNMWESLKKVYPEDNRLFVKGVKEEYFDELKFYNFSVVRKAVNREMARNKTKYAPNIDDIKQFCIDSVYKKREQAAFKEKIEDLRDGETKSMKEAIDDLDKKHFGGKLKKMRKDTKKNEDLPF